MNEKLTHIDEKGNARMVDVGGKAITARSATAIGRVLMQSQTLNLIKQQQVKKGDVLQIAQLAGIMGAKQTPNLIPLCHPLSLNAVEVTLGLLDEPIAVLVQATCRLDGKTGVEMEALTAVSIACLTVYDMLKAVDKKMVIDQIYLTEKTGGKSGNESF